MRIGLLLDMAADAAPDRPAVAERGSSISFAELRRRAQAAAAWLRGKDGDTVAFVGLNGPALPVALFAAAALERPFAPLNYRLADRDLNRLLARAAPVVAIVDDDMLARISPAPGVTALARSAFEAAAREAAASETGEDGSPIAVLLFTSGTTGEPKAAILRHENLTGYVVSSVPFLGAEDGDTALVSVPPYHIAGVSAVLSNVYAGRRIAYLQSFTPEQWVETAAAEGVTHAMVVPTMLGRILDVLERRAETLPCLRALSYGGGRMPLPTIERALSLLPHVDFANAYGLTETSSTISVLGPDDHRLAIYSDDEQVRRRLASVGKPIPGLEVEIRGPDGAALGPGQAGEIYVRGAQVSGEYAGSKATDEAGWFATKDGGWMDEDGFLFVEGRLDDVIVRGGENISPGEIEDVLREHPQVEDVAVFGVPDNVWGEAVAAAVVLRAAVSEDELAAWVKARLRSTKTPAIWVFRDSLPYNETGKLLRRELKAQTAGRLNDQETARSP